MKGKEIITRAVRAEMPDMEQLRENSIRQATKKGTVKQGVWVKRLIPAIACLAVMLAMVFIFPHFINNNITPTGTIPSETKSPTTDLSMRGLPVDNFSLANVESGGNLMDRMVFSDFASLWRYADCFVVVKVYDVKNTKSDDSYSFDTQKSDLVVLQNIYGECETDTLQIRQAIIKDHFCLGTTNLLRNEGVYLLPLRQIDGYGFHIVNDMDALFEIDDKGKVWSHSDFEDFNRYDGKNIEDLIEDLQNLFSDENFILVNSSFSNSLRSWTLANIKITSIEQGTTDQYGQSNLIYNFDINEILSEPTKGESISHGKTGSLTILTDETDKFTMIVGNQYLIYLDYFEDKIYTASSMIAEIGNDDTITAIPSSVGTSVFTLYNGLKTADIKDTISRIEILREAQK